MTREVCYLQDLFVDDTVRRRGCGAKLIEAVAAIARERGCQALLGDQGGQRYRTITLRPDRPVQRLYPLRLPARLALGGNARLLAANTRD